MYKPPVLPVQISNSSSCSKLHFQRTRRKGVNFLLISLKAGYPSIYISSFKARTSHTPLRKCEAFHILRSSTFRVEILWNSLFYKIGIGVKNWRNHWRIFLYRICFFFFFLKIEVKEIYTPLIDFEWNLHCTKLSCLFVKEGRTALHYCSACKDPDTIWDLLIEGGCDSSISDKRGNPAAYYLTHNNEIELPEGETMARRKGSNSKECEFHLNIRQHIIRAMGNYRIFIALRRDSSKTLLIFVSESTIISPNPEITWSMSITAT